MPPERTTLPHDGLTFDVAVTGCGTAGTALLLHGFPGGPRTWTSWTQPFDDAGIRSIVPAQRGYSANARPDAVSAYRIDHLVDDAVAVIEHLHDGPVHVVGHDWGGVVAWHVAALRPELVRSLVVLSTPHPKAYAASLVTSTQLLRSIYGLWFQLPKVPEVTLLARNATLLRTALVRSDLEPPTAEQYVTDMTEPGRLRAALHWYRAAIRSPRRTTQVGPITVPTTYVWGGRDPALGRRAARTTSDRVSATYRFVELTDATHWLPEMHRDLVWSHVLDRIMV